MHLVKVLFIIPSLMMPLEIRAELISSRVRCAIRDEQRRRHPGINSAPSPWHGATRGWKEPQIHRRSLAACLVSKAGWDEPHCWWLTDGTNVHTARQWVLVLLTGEIIIIIKMVQLEETMKDHRVPELTTLGPAKSIEEGIVQKPPEHDGLGASIQNLSRKPGL